MTARDARGRFVKAPTPTLEEVRQWMIEDYERPNEALEKLLRPPMGAGDPRIVVDPKPLSYDDDLRAASVPWPVGKPYTYVQTAPLPSLKVGDKVTIKLPDAPFSVSPKRPWWRRLNDWLASWRG